MRRIGFKARTLVVNDALVALEAGAPGEAGVVIISGTGSIAYGRNRRNEGARAGGWGHVLGDEGSGFWIGRAAMRAVLREADRRGPRTALTPLLAAALRCVRGAEPDPRGLPEPIRLHRRLARWPSACRPRSRWETTPRPGFCARPRTSSRPRVSAWLAGSDLDREPFAFILGGGIFRAVPWLREELQRRLPVAIPVATARVLDREPASGAVSLAIQEARGGAAIPAYKAE